MCVNYQDHDPRSRIECLLVDKTLLIDLQRERNYPAGNIYTEQRRSILWIQFLQRETMIQYEDTGQVSVVRKHRPEVK